MRVASSGGTLGEQLVVSGVIEDDDLTDFYRSRLLVPQVNPNTLARLPVRVVAAIPSDMAIELRAIPVSLDADNNLTVAMSDPSDSHAVDEIAFFTGTYVVRAVATQMQIAWCLAHYYGHITALGQKLLQPSDASAVEPPTPAVRPTPLPRAKGLTAKVDAARHRANAPITGPVDVPRPRSGELDLIPLAAQPKPAPAPAPEPPPDGVPDRPRARSVSGEIRVPIRRAPSIRPPMPEPLIAEDEDESGPIISVEINTSEDPTGPRMVPLRRAVKPDPPELAARAGEVDTSSGPVRPVDREEPRIIINDEPPVSAHVSGEIRIRPFRNDTAAPTSTIEVDDTSVGVVIHEHMSRESEPVLLERRRAVDASDDDDEPVVVLEARKQPPTPNPPVRTRALRPTQVGIGALPALTRAARDTEANSVPTALDDGPTRSERMPIESELEATRVHARAAPPPDWDTDETVAPPPSPNRPDDTSPTIMPPAPATARAASIPPRPTTADDEDGAPLTAVMSAVELDDVIPGRQSDVMIPAHSKRDRSVDYDPVDDGWGPPGTTIPPPLLGAIPGSEDDDPASQIPMHNVDDAPLIVAPPSPPEPARGTPTFDASGSILVRALEDATSRSIELIHALEHTQTRDEVIAMMEEHLAQTHRRAGFFSIKSGDLGVFSMLPKPELIPVTSLRLDRPSTLQDVVGTRLPYRGPMHDDASRNFLAAILGACPPEILLVPVAVRERVVGVLFGEHRMRHTFDDQLALAARAAGMALERILKSKRG
ncbi:MAG: hypothetical protein ABI867_16595 [Kofleriaceae bacterium]